MFIFFDFLDFFCIFEILLFRVEILNFSFEDTDGGCFFDSSSNKPESYICEY